VDVLSSVSISGSKSVSCWLSWADASRVKNSAHGRYGSEYTYPAGKLAIWERSALEMSPVGVWGVPGTVGVGSGVGCPHRSGAGAPVPLPLQRVWKFFVMPFWQKRHPAMWFWWSIAGCYPIAAFTFLSPRTSTPRFFLSRTSARRFCIRYCISSIVACENPLLAILAIFKARRMSHCSSCTRPPCLAIVADMLKTYKKLVLLVTIRFSYYLYHIRFRSLL